MDVYAKHFAAVWQYAKAQRTEALIDVQVKAEPYF